MNRFSVAVFGLWLVLAPTGCQCLVPVDDVPRAGVGSFRTVGGAPGGRDTPATVVFEGTLRLFARESVSQDLAWCSDAAGGCVWETLDGAGGPDGRIVGDVGAECITAITWGSALHVFYRQDSASSAHVLRHGVFSSGAWSFETLDGNGGDHGRTEDRVGGCPSATAFSSWLFIGFYDYDLQALRLGWYGGRDWDFKTLDGRGGGSGRMTGDVGYWSAMVTTSDSVRAFYTDATNQDLREAAWSGGAGVDWTFVTRDGQPRQGTLGNISGRLAAVVHQSATHVFYQDASTGDLRHAWSKASWSYEVLDGAGGTGRTTNAVGARAVTAASTGAVLHVFYDDSTDGNLRHSWLDGSAWNTETADGDSNLDGRIDADVGRSAASVPFGNGVRVFYEGPSATLRQAAW